MSETCADPSALLARRARVLAPSYRLFYAQPLQIVRAEDVWMYDERGRAYLDAYNNVPVVGHCHPRVVEALTRQARTLNTHTRYLGEQPLQLAEALLGTLPPELARVIFTCTGSEANDLAVQVCKSVTGRSGFIISDFAYHGATEVTAGMSPEEGMPLGPGVYTVPSPLSEGGPEGFGARVRACIERMRAEGVAPAALLVDTIFSSDGVVADPRGFLAEAVQHVRAAGGLFIADEVQAGFGRPGESMWGFQRHGLVPDLVTMGKPMGNGHPVAAVVARPDIFEVFAKRRRYFNTFGGNSVSCAVALAVLQVIREEGLLANAARSGAHLLRGLAGLAKRTPQIRTVRGAGLFIGVELEGGAAAAARVANELRERGVLVGTTGRRGDVVKIRPPLTLRTAHADLLLKELAGALGVT
ncbi:MAG: aspartate aminotransferase family protein [Gammaproteobacteria bacterium]|nr:aspartate aminotransferase family protein [Gammaproteobacteria bacterium]